MEILNSKLRVGDAAKYLNLRPSTLAKMRMRGDGPPYSKAGLRVVLYERGDLDAWVHGRRRHSTSEVVPLCLSGSR